MLKKLINKFIVNQEIYKKVEEEATYYHNLWQKAENNKNIDAIKKIHSLIKSADKRNKIIKEINKICKEILK